MTPLQENLRWIINTAPKHIYLDTDPITVTAHFLSIGLVTVRVKDDAVSALHPCTASASVQQDTDIADEPLLTFLGRNAFYQ